MRRILVPLDGSPLAESIIPDARLMAGQDGELVLVREATIRAYYEYGAPYWWLAADEVQEYLEGQAERLRAEGVNAQAQTLACDDVSLAIDEAARIFKVDMIACATHGRGPLGRLIHGSVAWKALAHSPVPVLLRHPDIEPENEIPHRLRRIMVPLDGSSYAEHAVPFARRLARDWNASLWLVRVVAAMIAPDMPYSYGDGMTYDHRVEMREARDYLDRIALRLEGDIHTQVLFGGVTNQLIFAADSYSITDIVLASHGRTGLSRVILGSVADELIQRLSLPIVVIPATAAQTMSLAQQQDEPVVTSSISS